jgi:hypothetical protein
METERLQRKSYKRNMSYAVNQKGLITPIWILVKLQVRGLTCKMSYNGEN